MEQIVLVLKQAKVGVSVAELIRKVLISEQMPYRRKAKYIGLEVDQVRQPKSLAQVPESSMRAARSPDSSYETRTRG